MATYVKAVSTSELASGQKKTMTVAGVRLMIANVGGKFFAIDDACTHVGCSLGEEGMLDGPTITCGCHGGKFNVASGKVVGPPPQKDTKSYSVKVEGNDVVVLL